MDGSSMKRMALRVAGDPGPVIEPLFELTRVIEECRTGMMSIMSGVGEGRLSEASMLELQRSLDDKARTACESLRSCKNQIDAVLPRTKSDWHPTQMESVPR